MVMDEGGPDFCLAEDFNKEMGCAIFISLKVPALCSAVEAQSPEELSILTLASVSVVAFQLFWRIMS